MVRKLGVSHKSLLVPSVTAGTYSIRYEHADYLDRNFNITVGSGLPTTFSEAMVEKTYNMMLEFPSTTLLTNATIFEGDDIVFNTFMIRNGGNIAAYAWYSIVGAGLTLEAVYNLLLAPGHAATLSITDQATTAGIGDHSINLNVGPSPSAQWVDIFPTSDSRAETLTILEWTTDITFIATAPGISDLHGVEVFIDNVSMGTT